MALSSFVGSGHFVQDREWTCPKHDWPMEHICDCDRCSRKWDCSSCARAKWRDLFNDDGTPMMRETGVWEHSHWLTVADDMRELNALLAMMMEKRPADEPKIVWMDDE